MSSSVLVSARSEGRAALHRLLARRLRELADGDALLERSIYLAARARDEGHVCLELGPLAGRVEGGAADEVRAPGEGDQSTQGDQSIVSDARTEALPELSTWRAALLASPAVVASEHAAAEPAPLVLAGERLYFLREWRAEQRLAANVARRLGRAPRPIEAGDLAPLFRRLFSPESPSEPSSAGRLDRQSLAAALALHRSLVLVTGGPGTGKTHTVARLLALALADDPSLRVLLAAPTGKAAARLGESLGEQIDTLPLDTWPIEGGSLRETLRRRLPRTGSTLHRLLGYDPRRERFSRRRLRCDLLVVDEASMIDLLMMDAVFEALPPAARVVLLGDRDQLASVEAGFVFGDLATVAGLGPSGAASPRYGAAFRDRFERLAGEAARAALDREEPKMDGTVPEAGVALERSWRFEARPGIGRLAAALRAGDASGAFAALDDPDLPAVSRSAPSEDASWLLGLLPALRRVVDAEGPADALDALGAVRLLAVRRGGPLGVDATNRAVTARLGQSDRPWRAGRPILVETNAPDVGLWNGDLGILWTEAVSSEGSVLEDSSQTREASLAPERGGPERGGGRLWAYFPALVPGEPPRRLAIAKLPRVTTAWAMTVHKSQGSEVDHVVLLLPESDLAVATRELLYTGVTRARDRVEIVGTEATIAAAVGRSARRSTGLVRAVRDALSMGAGGRPSEPMESESATARDRPPAGVP